jgi:hypothetical protein
MLPKENRGVSNAEYERELNMSSLNFSLHPHERAIQVKTLIHLLHNLVPLEAARRHAVTRVGLTLKY